MESLRKSIGIKQSLIICTIALACFGCKKNGVAPANHFSSASKVAFGVQSDNAAVNLMASTSKVAVNAVTTVPQIMWTTGVANIAKFKFEAKRNGAEKEFETTNLTNVDLFALSPSLVSTSIDTGTYKEIEIKLVLVQSADTTMLPLKLTGTFTNTQGVAIPVELDLNTNLEIKAEAKDVVVSATQNLQTIFLLHLNKLSDGITATDLGSADQTGGKIIISSTSNTNIFNKILQNVSNIGDSKFESEKNDQSGDGGSHGSGGNENDG